MLLIFVFWCDDRVGIKTPEVEIRFENLSVEGDAYVGSRALPTLLNATINSLEVVKLVMFPLCISCPKGEIPSLQGPHSPTRQNSLGGRRGAYHIGPV